MWTEHVPDEATLDSKVFPRAMAMAELLWSGNESKDYEDFSKRVDTHRKAFLQNIINMGLEGIPARIETSLLQDEIRIKVIPQLDDLVLNATLDTEPIALEYSLSEQKKRKNAGCYFLSAHFSILRVRCHIFRPKRGTGFPLAPHFLANFRNKH